MQLPLPWVLLWPQIPGVISLGLMPGLEPFGIASKGQGEMPNPGNQLVFAAWLDDFIDVCKGTEVVGVLGPSSTASRTGLWCGCDMCQGEQAGPPPVAAWPGSVPTSVPPSPGKGHTTLCGTPGAAKLASPPAT